MVLPANSAPSPDQLPTIPSSLTGVSVLKDLYTQFVFPYLQMLS